MTDTQSFIVAKGISKSFGRKSALREVSVNVSPGEVIGVLGKNGAGKTTLLELILGFTRPTSGAIKLFGYDSFRLPGDAKARVGFVPQHDELVNQLSGADQLRLIGSFYPRWDQAMITRLSETWEIDLGQRISEMSVGQRQKLSILLALGHNPDLLILDEPVASLDPLARRQFLEQIVEVAADPGRSVIFSSHIVSDVERLANKIWIIKDQRLHWAGDIDHLKQSIMRVHVRALCSLPPSFSIPNALRFERQDTSATAVVYDWSEAIQERIIRETGAELDEEPLALEDIFLELHR